jgi:hypothetical protein
MSLPWPLPSSLIWLLALLAVAGGALAWLTDQRAATREAAALAV